MKQAQTIISQPFPYHHQSMLSMHKDSHTISKSNLPPKIRIIHIYEPEIIKTSVEEFKRVVQRLTGKNQLKNKTKKSKHSSMPPPNGKTRINHLCPEKIKREELLLQNDLVHHHRRLEMKKESEEDDHLNSYLNGFGDMDNYCFNIQELVGDFTVLPFKSTNQIDNAYIEMPLC
ncbi:hypothetical protein LIER_41143 [Lithospermum erythrorhizon]|uniref:VQ domain-containing protein n=1 Tax=Lithospermum erythrorhizon TaxID=34254 RepID=A0AAV3R6T6_LITER